MEEEVVAKLLKVELQRLAILQQIILLLDAVHQLEHLRLVHLDAGPLKGVHQLRLVDLPVVVEVNVLEEHVQLLLILQAVGDKLRKVNVAIGVPV